MSILCTPDFWRCWHCLLAAGAHIFICQATEGCYYTFTVYQGFLFFILYTFSLFGALGRQNLRKLKSVWVKFIGTLFYLYRKQLSWRKKQENLKKQLMHFIRKKGVEVREESGAKMWKLLKRYIFVYFINLHSLVLCFRGWHFAFSYDVFAFVLETLISASVGGLFATKYHPASFFLFSGATSFGRRCECFRRDVSSRWKGNVWWKINIYYKYMFDMTNASL